MESHRWCRRRSLAFLLAVLMLLAGTPLASASPVTLTVELDAGQWRGVRLPNLPRGVELRVELEVTGELVVTLVDEAGARTLPAIGRALFQGQADRRLVFTVVTPAAGTYVLVLDNRGSTETRRARVTVRAGLEGREATASVTLTAFENGLKQLFVFDPFPIGIKRCGAPRSFAPGRGVMLCAEYAERLARSQGGATAASDTLLFSLFHELGHVLLAQWRHPQAASEETADQFATALMVMLGQQDRSRAAAEFFASDAPEVAALRTQFRADRHAVSAERARSVLAWLDDPAIVRAWQPVLVPHIQTAVLERLLAQPFAWTVRELVEKELAARRAREPRA